MRNDRFSPRVQTRPSRWRVRGASHPFHFLGCLRTRLCRQLTSAARAPAVNSQRKLFTWYLKRYSLLSSILPIWAAIVKGVCQKSHVHGAAALRFTALFIFSFKIEFNLNNQKRQNMYNPFPCLLQHPSCWAAVFPVNSNNKPDNWGAAGLTFFR